MTSNLLRRKILSLNRNSISGSKERDGERRPEWESGQNSERHQFAIKRSRRKAKGRPAGEKATQKMMYHNGEYFTLRTLKNVLSIFCVVTFFSLYLSPPPARRFCLFCHSPPGKMRGGRPTPSVAYEKILLKTPNETKIE